MCKRVKSVVKSLVSSVMPIAIITEASIKEIKCPLLTQSREDGRSDPRSAEDSTKRGNAYVSFESVTSRLLGNVGECENLIITWRVSRISSSGADAAVPLGPVIMGFAALIVNGRIIVGVVAKASGLSQSSHSICNMSHTFILWALCNMLCGPKT